MIILARESNGSNQSGAVELVTSGCSGEQAFGCCFLTSVRDGSVLTPPSLQHVFLGQVGFECGLQMRAEQSWLGHTDTEPAALSH